MFDSKIDYSKYLYTCTFGEDNTHLRQGARECDIYYNAEKDAFIITWMRLEKSYSCKLSVDNSIAMSAFSGFINYPPAERGYRCYQFLNVLKRLEKSKLTYKF